ncbi:MAG: DEAD/DEAH box helicase [Verrucomicrobiaceae bacterium]|nr:MAG: DEAD/DEAH box helicase [Verrucomicrobiaceae bacterium]
MELTEKFLVSMCGWPVFKEARAMHAAGRVSEAAYTPPVLRGKISADGKAFLAGLKIRNAIDVENLCPCRDSRVRGIICAHSVAVGLEVLAPSQETKSASLPSQPQSARVPSTSELPKVVLSLEGSLRHLEADISFQYTRPGFSNHAAEAAAIGELMACGFEDVRGKAALRGEESVVGFFAAALPKLKAKWDVREGERFAHVTRDIVRIEPHFAIREKEDGWLDFHVHFTAGSDAVLTQQDVQRLLQSGTPHVKLKDGRLAVPDAGLAADLEEVLRDCDPSQERGAYRVRPAQREYLEESIAAWSGKPVETSLPDIPLGPLGPRLRPYQVEGARWLLHLAREKSGGLLADEMGLGKTVQALAMIESHPGPHLVVCPSSLVWNWRREAEHFTPGLRVIGIEGSSREKHLESLGSADIAITSYALLRRDIDRYRNIRFSTVILDEAQHIKNPDSRNAKAACALEADARFILTGTPLENSLRDVWSLFDFLLPGYLGSRKDFQERYEKPLLDGESSALWERLHRRVRPRMLRRKKADLLKDLPDKIEQIVEVELSPAQKDAYTRLQIAARAEVDALRESGGSAKIKIFTALLRLRQACCDLRLLGADAPGSSAKMDALLELIGEAVDGEHRVLVFSQFTSMLDLIGPALDEAGFAYCRLDGSTKDRASVVEKFQSDASIPVFLISLKAGGTGLNLTAADTVIHFDPWWNPAVEAQATDRAHRIGQSKVVTSIKLIARDTVEHRVIAMQEKKRAMISGLLDSESTVPDAAELIELIG